MMRYQLLFVSAALLFPLYTAAVESTDASEQERGMTSSSGDTPEQDMAPSEAAPKHHHHHKHPATEAEVRIRLPSDKTDSTLQDKGQPKSAEEAEEEMPAAGEPKHHHKHPAQGAKAQVEQPPEEMEGHIHHMFGHEHHTMDMDVDGMVMNENKDELPRDCPKLAGDVEITVRAGTKYAEKFPGTIFGYDQHEWNVEPCTRITITLINEDEIRHQWMAHGLPKYIYPQGMFHIEVSGPGRRTGTFIVPSTKKTYFVHCDISQHTEKGMKAQLKVGGGDQDFPSIPGITAPIFPDSYEREISWSTIGSSLGAGIIGLALAIIGLGRINRKAEPEEAKGIKGTSRIQGQGSAPETKQRWWSLRNK